MTKRLQLATLAAMVIIVTTEIADDPSGCGVRLRMRAEDDTGRAWSRWYGNEGFALEDSWINGTPAVSVTISHQETGPVQTYALYPRQRIDTDLLDGHWGRD